LVTQRGGRKRHAGPSCEASLATGQPFRATKPAEERGRPLNALRSVAEATEFHAGLLAGLVAAAAIWWAAGPVRRSARRPVAVSGAAFAGASLVAPDRVLPFGRVRGVPVELVVAVGPLVLAGVIAGWGRARCCCSARSAGVYATVPNTEAALVLLGVAVLGFPIVGAALGNGGAYARGGNVPWAVAVGATGRPAALVGALGTFGVLVAKPVGRLISRPSPGRAGAAGPGRGARDPRHHAGCVRALRRPGGRNPALNRRHAGATCTARSRGRADRVAPGRLGERDGLPWVTAG